MKKPATSRRQVFLVIIAIVVVAVGGMGWYWCAIELPAKPPEPIAASSFPSQPVWIFKAPGQITSSPSVHGSQIFVRTDTTLYALDAFSGKTLWLVESPSDRGQTAIPSKAENILAVPEKDAWTSLFAMDTGKLLWRWSGPSENASSSYIESIALGFDAVYVARHNWALTAYSPQSGMIRWEKNVPSRTTLDIVADNEAVYLGAQRRVTAYEEMYGVLLWQMDFEGEVEALLLSGNTLYIALSYGRQSLVAMDVRTHSVLWEAHSAELQAAVLTSLAVADEVLYVSGTRLFALSAADGAALWQDNIAEYLEQPVVLNNRVYVRNDKTTLFVLDAKTGQTMGHLLVQSDYPLLGRTGRGPAVAGDLLIVPFGDNRLFAYRP